VLRSRRVLLVFLMDLIACAPGSKRGVPRAPKAADAPGAESAKTMGADAAAPSGVATPMAATTAPPSASDDAADAGASVDVVRPCDPKAKAHATAAAELERLGKSIDALGATGDVSPVNAALTKMLETPCFALAEGESIEPLVFDSGLSAKTWWSEGGQAWLAHYLELGEGRAKHHANHPLYSWVPPSPRKTLTAESAKGSPLAPILCRADDATCGAETRGWLQRADEAFTAHALARREEPWTSEPRQTCAAKARQAKRGAQYAAWRTCIDETRERHGALPLGRFRAPTEGWLVLRGRRGHYHFCDEIRAYDLATGAAWITGTCGGLLLRENGSVDQKKTDDGRGPRSEAGRLPQDNLREAALATFLAPHVQEQVLQAGFGLALPDDLALEMNQRELHGLGMSWRGTSAQTTVSWSWVVSGRTVTSGELTWPQNYNEAGADHAVKLLQIAEAAYAPLKAGECAPAAPPSPLPLGAGAPRVSKIDGAVDSSVTGAATSAFKAVKVPVCAPVRGASR
jgi:hypothetical protein